METRGEWEQAGREWRGKGRGMRGPPSELLDEVLREEGEDVVFGRGGAIVRVVGLGIVLGVIEAD